MDDICTGIKDKGPHNEDTGENDCPFCRIAELEQLLTEYKDAECKAVKAESEALKTIKVLEDSIEFLENDLENWRFPNGRFF